MEAAKPVRTVLQQRRILVDTPGDDIEEDADVAIVRLGDEVLDRLELLFAGSLPGKPVADRLDPVVGIMRSAVDRRKPDAIDPGLGQMVEDTAHALERAVGRGGVDPHFDQDQALEPIRRLHQAVCAHFHHHLAVRKDRRQQIGVAQNCRRDRRISGWRPRVVRTAGDRPARAEGGHPPKP